MTHDLRPAPIERICQCSTLSRPWWQHHPACDNAFRARFFDAVRSMRNLANPWRQ